MFIGHFKCINDIYIISKLSLFRNNISQSNNIGISDNVNSTLNINDTINNNMTESLKDKFKRRLFWVI